MGDGVGLKEERLSIRKPSTSTIGSRSIPTPSSPMVSSAHNPNKAEIPDRRKDVASAAVRLETMRYSCGDSARAKNVTFHVQQQRQMTSSSPSAVIRLFCSGL